MHRMKVPFLSHPRSDLQRLGGRAVSKLHAPYFWVPRPHTQGFSATCCWALGLFMPLMLFIRLKAEARLLGFIDLGKWALDDYEALNCGASLIGTVQRQSEPRTS